MLAGRSGSALFVMPPGGAISYFSEHLGTAFLRAVLARAGIPAEAYLPDRNPSLPAFAGFLAERRPAIVGFTAYETNLKACRAMARVARETLPEAIVAVGGPNATFSPEETLELLGADLCLRGAGEGTIAAIAGAVLGAERPRRRLPDLLGGVPNLVLRTPDGVSRTRAGDLSSFPGEHFGCLDDLPSPYQDGIVRTADIGLLTARGCNQHCTYCSFAAISGRRVHYHGVERVLDDLAAYKALVLRVERRKTSVSILDDAFSLAPGRARAICEGIIRRGLELPFDCETRADRVDAELLRLMRRAGFVGVSFGLESAVPRVLRAIGKVKDPAAAGDPEFEAERAYLESFRRAVSAAKKARLLPSVSVMGGLPGETADDFRATLAFVASLRVPMYAHNVLAVLPGTPLHRDRERHGLRTGRDAISGLWRTHHGYDAEAVSPLGNSLTHAVRWEEASQISDALCGRPRAARGCDEAAWAVVLHGCTPDARVAAWLHEVLAVHGALVVASAPGESGPREHEGWLRILRAAEVPFGLFALLSAEGAPGGALVLRSPGTQGEHRFEIDPVWRSAGRAVEADETGGCRVLLWMASGAAAPPPAAGADGLPAPGPQIADGCRWWSGWRRCRHPQVLHVFPDGTVRPCWHGPTLGTVGDRYADLAARGRALRPGADAAPSDRCPLAGPDEERSGATERYEIAAQLSWLVRQAPKHASRTRRSGGRTWTRNSSERSSAPRSTPRSRRS